MGNESKDDIVVTEDVEASPEQKRSEKTQVDAGKRYDLLRTSGDASLYWYYLKSIGWRFAVIGLGFGALFAFLQVFSRKLTAFHPTHRCLA
jgi:hypothetical protein